MVLATRGDCELFDWKTIPVRDPVTAWHNTLSEMGMVVISSTLTVGPIDQTLNDAGRQNRSARPGSIARASIPAFCKRPSVVGRGCQDAESQTDTALLRMGRTQKRSVSSAMLGVPFRPGAAHVVALGPVAIADAVDQAVPLRDDPVEVAEQRHQGELCGAHDDLNAALPRTDEKATVEDLVVEIVADMHDPVAPVFRRSVSMISDRTTQAARSRASARLLTAAPN